MKHVYIYTLTTALGELKTSLSYGLVRTFDPDFGYCLLHLTVPFMFFAKNSLEFNFIFVMSLYVSRFVDSYYICKVFRNGMENL